jgi:hypothetical protein
LVNKYDCSFGFKLTLFKQFSLDLHCSFHCLTFDPVHPSCPDVHCSIVTLQLYEIRRIYSDGSSGDDDGGGDDGNGGDDGDIRW